MTHERTPFDIPERIAYLNCASMCVRLHAVSAAGHEAVDRMGRPWAVRADDWFTQAAQVRAQFAQVIGAKAASVALVPSVSYGIALAARNLPVRDGQNIVVLADEFPSNYYSWARLARERGGRVRTARPQPGESPTDAVIAAIDRDTAIVSVPNCHWTDGRVLDVIRIGEAARRHGAALVLDASQSIGALPLDVEAVRPDFLVTVGYKWLLGPYGVGYLYVDERWHDGVPLEESWLHREGADNFAALADYTSAYKPGAQRYNQGEPPQFYLLPMAAAALTQVNLWTPAHIQATLREWTDELAARVAPLGLATPAAHERVGHILGLTFAQGLPAGINERLRAEDIYVGLRGKGLRVAPHLHATAEHLDRLVGALGRVG